MLIGNNPYTMSKRLKLVTRSLGAEPGIPDAGTLARWIRENRGTAADLTTYRLLQSFIPQRESGIDIPCAGGKFMKDRVLECILGIADAKTTGELGVRAHALVEDGYAITAEKRKSWCALPAPHLLGITDTYYFDESEWSAAINSTYKTLLREMRDAGITGHILIGDTAGEEEVAALARQNVVFYVPEPDRQSLEIQLEHQHLVAVGNDRLGSVFDLVNEYDLRQIIIVDADRKGIALALTHLDPDQVLVGGYCTVEDDEYWKNIVKTSDYAP
jgi:hypothetical protein